MPVHIEKSLMQRFLHQGRIFRGTTLFPALYKADTYVRNVHVTSSLERCGSCGEIHDLSEPEGASSARVPLSGGKQATTEHIHGFYL